MKYYENKFDSIRQVNSWNSDISSDDLIKTLALYSFCPKHYKTYSRINTLNHFLRLQSFLKRVFNKENLTYLKQVINHINHAQLLKEKKSKGDLDLIAFVRTMGHFFAYRYVDAPYWDGKSISKKR